MFKVLVMDVCFLYLLDCVIRWLSESRINWNVSVILELGNSEFILKFSKSFELVCL